MTLSIRQPPHSINNAIFTTLPLDLPPYSINAVGVDVALFSAMAHEEEILLLPGLPLVNRAGENPEEDLWTFEVETPDASVSGDSPTVMIDYVHPGAYISGSDVEQYLYA